MDMDIARASIRDCQCLVSEQTNSRAFLRSRAGSYASGVVTGIVFSVTLCVLIFKPRNVSFLTGGTVNLGSGGDGPDIVHAPLFGPPWQQSRQLNTSASTWCPFGTLPGTWEVDKPPGGKWRLLVPPCQLHNLLPAYTSPVAGVAAQQHSNATSNSTFSAGSHSAGHRHDSDGHDVDDSVDAPLIDWAAAAAPLLPPGVAATARIMFLSDSVDKYILQHLCEAAHGVVRSVLTRSGRASTGVRDSRPLARNISSYVVHTCVSNSGLRLVAAYLPGVHPTGPYHRHVAQTYKQRIDRAVAVWNAYSPGVPPQVVVTSCLLWDIARMSAWEPWLVSGEQLSTTTLSSWTANYSRVVQYAMQSLPGVGLFAFHTTAPPRHDFLTGRADKSYLGRRVYVDQLNAAGRAAAHALGLEIIDYELVGSRFREGQVYLADNIHLGPLVGLEIANVYLNYVQQLSGGGRRSMRTA